MTISESKMALNTGSDLSIKVFVGRTHTFEDGSGTFSPTTSTLIIGRTDAVLVDAQHIREDVQSLCDLIAQTAKRLTTIYVTHGHADHWYGISELARRFPSARAVATADVVEYIENTKAVAAQRWRTMFGNRVVTAERFPEIIKGPIELDGHKLYPIEVGQADIAPSTVLHVPTLDLVVAGDVVYNQIHMMLGLTGPQQWEQWIESINKVEQLAPKVVVAGHKRPEASDQDVSRMIDETRSYIGAFAEAAKKANDADDLVQVMSDKYPHFGNLWTLQFSARSYFAKRSP
jgi:glyoxylase-like metal-dependent hydrolase (beta-lactamase superfamily II)